MQFLAERSLENYDYDTDVIPDTDVSDEMNCKYDTDELPDKPTYNEISDSGRHMINEQTENKERYILIAVDTGIGFDAEKSLEELAELLDTAGGETADIVIQHMESPSPATYLGSGKVEELREYILAENEANEENAADPSSAGVEEKSDKSHAVKKRSSGPGKVKHAGDHVEQYKITGVIADDELSPAQMDNLEQILQCKVLDRTTLILDIFAQHARTREGKIQVEMAQLSYRSSRLAGSLGGSLSRQGGGIGTRGPGESQLESDRRAIRKRMGVLRSQIREMEQARSTGRKLRLENKVPVIAIVGYTNAGKSTLLNRLTDSDVLEEDQLFATLDPTTRSGRLPDGQKVLFTDTVGFIHKLPHELVDAFHSTLEEASYADIILHVIDASDPDWEMHRQVVYDTLDALEIAGKPVITAFNKSDLLEEPIHGRDPRAGRTVQISAATGSGIEELTGILSSVLEGLRVYIDRFYPYTDGKKVNRIHQYGKVISEDYTEDGIHITAYVPRAMAGQV